jgi:hypothetical protein
MRAALLLLPLTLLLVGGCAQRQPLYAWGDYEGLLYRSYKQPEKAVEMRLKLEEHITAQEEAKGKVAPGLYAELGTLYFQSGKSDTAVSYYRKEQQAWPESSALMTAMIRAIERRASGSKP